MERRLAGFDPDRLLAPVRAALGNESAQPISWSCSTIARGAGGGMTESAVYRLHGRARIAGRNERWRAILKVLRNRGDKLASDEDWKREAAVYRSVLFDELPEGLAAPRCLGLEELPDGSFWLWLEDVADEISEWPLQRYGLAARHLGVFGGLFLSRQAIPNWSWLSRDFIRRDLAHVIAKQGRLRDSMELPIMRQFFPGNSRSSVFDVLADRETFLAALERLPSTVCHFDAFRRNMMTRRTQGRDETVLIDWASIGVGPIGAELASLVWVSLASMEVTASEAAKLSRTVYAAFLAGLRDAGWGGDERLVRLGYTASIALRRLGTYGHAFTAIVDGSLPSWVGPGGVSMSACAEQWAQAGEYVETLAEEAQTLIEELA